MINKKSKVSLLLSPIFFIILILCNTMFAFADDVWVSNNSTNINKATSLVENYIFAFGAVCIGVGVTVFAIKLMIHGQDANKRGFLMENLQKILLGSFIIGAVCIITGFLVGLINQTGIKINTTTSSANNPFSTSSDGNGSFFLRALCDVINAIPTWIISTGGRAAGFLPIKDLFFPSSATDLAPFTSTEWHNLNYLYICVTTLVSPLLLIMVARTGFQLILSTTSASKKVELSQELLRWLFSISIIATAPFFIQGMFTFFNYLTLGLKDMTSQLWSMPDTLNYNSLDSISSGNILVTAIMKFLYTWQFVKINMIFLARKVVISVMYAFTPIAAALMGINDRINAFSVWFGEMITNAAMQFSYSFTLTVMLVCLGTGSWSNWLLSIVWMNMLIKVSEMLRNLLQGLYQRLAGVDEESAAGGAMTAVGGLFSGATSAFGQAMGKGNGRGMYSAGEFGGRIFGNAARAGNTGAGPRPSPVAGGTTTGGATTGGATTGGATTGGTTTGGATTGGTTTGGTTTGGATAVSPNSMQKQKTAMADQNVYNKMLGDNLNKRMGNRKNIAGIAGNILSAATLGDPKAQGLINGVGSIINGTQDRIQAGRAINDTAQQIQDLSREVKGYNTDGSPILGNATLTKQQSLDKLFQTNNGELDKNGIQKKSNERKNRFKFIDAVSKGNMSKASNVLGKSHPYTNSSTEVKNAIIAESNPYTSFDGFKWK